MTDTQTKRRALHIERISALVHGSNQLAFCAMGSFTAIYLGFLGFTDSEIGFTSSLVSLFAVAIQLLLADFSDKHSSLPLKYIVTGMYAAGIVLAAAVNFLPLPIAAMMLVYALAHAFSNAMDCFISAMIMQFANAGIPVRYGWPRSVGSVTFALLALGLGWVIEEQSPAILMPLYMILAVIAMTVVCFMPSAPKSPEAAANRQSRENKISYPQMLKRNPTLLLFILAMCVCSLGNSPSYTFLIRIVERLGGNASTLGLALFLQACMELPSLCLSSFFVRKFRRRTLLTMVMALRLVRILGIMLAPNLTVFFLVTCVGGFNNGISMFASVEFINSIVSDGERVRSQSLLSFTNTFGSVVGTALAGVILDSLGLGIMLGSGCAIVACGMGLMLVCARLHRKGFGNV